MKHLGVLAHSTGGAALCFLTFCEEGFRRTGRNEHPDVTLDYIAFGYSMPAWDAGDPATVRATLAPSAQRLARAGADFFVCPDNTAHMALEVRGPDLPLPGLHIAEVVASHAAERGFQRIGLTGTRWLVNSEIYPEKLTTRGLDYLRPNDGEREEINRIHG